LAPVRGHNARRIGKATPATWRIREEARWVATTTTEPLLGSRSTSSARP